MPKLNTKRGLTLIELLIAITLVGILAGIISFSMIGQQRKARDAKRKNDLQQVKRALESAKNDCLAGSYYPLIDGGDGANKYIAVADMLKNNGYIDEAPQDPKFTDSGDIPKYWYEALSSTSLNVCKNNGTPIAGLRNYYLYAHLEITKDPDTARSLAKCGITLPFGDLTTSDYVVCPD